MTSASPAPSLRERKKIRTRQTIRRAAYRLFAEHGYDATRVDTIAAAAEVSPSTVFRYFPTKEDIVVTDEDDPVFEAALRSRPADEAPLTALRAAIHQTLDELYVTPEAMAEVHLRMRLVATVPTIRARMKENAAANADLLTRALTARTGHAADSLELRVFVGSLIGGLTEALMYWAESGLEEDVRTLVDRAMTVLHRDLAD
ncbi:hypothetical protein SUDANB171_01968 [Streptomyces sp. enrichment culture]|uniref:TetR/AcrR family transcriptional regulator n=1 Tax=Streptomyces sp. enrichment culture TaxID=1795815 RepID=UPI003F567A6E